MPSKFTISVAGWAGTFLKQAKLDKNNLRIEDYSVRGDDFFDLVEREFFQHVRIAFHFYNFNKDYLCKDSLLNNN